MERRGWIFTLAAGAAALSALNAYWLIDRRFESDAEARLASLEAEMRHFEAETAAAKNEARIPMAGKVEPAAPLAGPLRSGAATAPDEVTEAEHAGDSERDSPPPPLENRLNEAFAVERPDPAWDRPATDRVRDAFSSALPPESSIRDMSCRGSLCRVEVAHASEDAHADLVRTFLQDLDFWDGPGSISAVTEGTGQIVTVAFLGRPGSDLTPGSVWE